MTTMLPHLQPLLPQRLPCRVLLLVALMQPPKQAPHQVQLPTQLNRLLLTYTQPMTTALPPCRCRSPHRQRLDPTLQRRHQFQLPWSRRWQ